MKKILLALLFLSFTLGEVARIELGSGVAVKLLDIIVGITAVGGIVEWIFRKEKKQYVGLIAKVFFVFCGVGLLGIIFNVLSLSIEQLMISALYLFRLVSYILTAYFIYTLSNDEKSFAHKGLLISGVGILLLGFIQFFLYSSLRNLYYLGWDEHLHRMFSTFLDPNFAGVFFVLYFLFLIPNLLQKKNLSLYIPISVFTVLAIFLTYSRTAFIMLLVSTVVLLWMMGKKKVIVLFFCLLLIVGGVLSSTYKTHNTDPFRVASSLSRVTSAENAVAIFSDHPLIGVGFNSYRYAMQTYSFEKPQEILYNHAEAGTDNSFLFVLATTGIVGLTIYLYLSYLLLIQSNEIRKSGKVVFSVVFISSFVGLGVASLFTNCLFYTPFIFWMGSIYALREYR